MASYSQPGSGTKFIMTSFSIKYLLRNRSFDSSIGRVILTGRQILEYRRPVASNILQSWAEDAQQFITNSPISYIRAVMAQGCGDMLLARDKKWWWITWLLLAAHRESRWGSMNLFWGSGSGYDTMTKTGSHGTDWDSSRRRTRYWIPHPWDRLHQHLAKSTSQVSTLKVLARQFVQRI